MNKTELLKNISKEIGIAQKDAKKFWDSMISAIEKELKNGGRLVIPGFGTFSVSQRPERKARNFKTGKMIKVPSSKYVKFKVGKTLKESVK